MARNGEVHVDQAHRGYSLATDETGYASPNPLFMKYTPDARGQFAGQNAYGYQSIADFVDAACLIGEGKAIPSDFRDQLATVRDTLPVTTILEAGRESLDSGMPVDLHAPEPS